MKPKVQKSKNDVPEPQPWGARIKTAQPHATGTPTDGMKWIKGANGMKTDAPTRIRRPCRSSREASISAIGGKAEIGLSAANVG
jgi:hypothetical protein